MNYNAADIEKLPLKKEWICGYSRAQVERILAKIKQDYYEAADRIKDLYNELAVMKETVQHYKTIEESLQHTLILAHSTAEAIKMNAVEKAANIVAEAELKAQKTVDDASVKVIRIQSEYVELKNSLKCYKSKTQALLNSLQELLSETVEDGAE